MTQQSLMVVALYRDVTNAQQAVRDLQRAGFDKSQISYLGHGAPKGILSNLASLLTGEPASTERVYEHLRQRGLPDEDARFFQSEYDAGRNIVAITASARLDEASRILINNGGYGMGGHTDTVIGSASVPPLSTEESTVAQHERVLEEVDTTQRIPLREEKLRIFKQDYEAGELTLHKDVVAEQQVVDVPVYHEEIVIERYPGSDQPVETHITEGEIIRIPVHEERVDVEKRTFVREEVALGKHKVEGVKHISETVHHEEAHLTRKGEVDVEGKDIGDIEVEEQQ